MSFGFGVGDFLAVIDLAKNLRGDFVNAPNEFKSITDELRNFDRVLVDVETYLNNASETQKETFKSLTETCDSVRKDLVKLRDKYIELEATPGNGTTNAPATAHSKRRSVRKIWKKIKWDSGEVTTLRQRLISNTAILQAFLDIDTRQGIRKVDEGVVRLTYHQDDRVKNEILEWLTPINYGSEQSDFLSRKEDGTGQWFLDSPEYQGWIRKDRRTLFCPGIPGAGKTILTSIVVDELATHFGADKTVGIAYLYCNFRRNHDQKLTDLLASLLKQLASTLSYVPNCLAALHAKHYDAKTRPSLRELIDTLHAVAGLFSKTFVIVDALDECQTMGGCQSMLISEMFHMQSKCGTNIFATSRFIPDITSRFSSLPESVVSSDPCAAATQPMSTQLEIRASKKDIEKFLDGNISKLPAHKHWNDHLRETIKTGISGVVDGMFLLAQLYLQSFHDKTKPSAVKKVLESLRNQEPGSSESQKKRVLDLAYDDAIQRINEQGESFRELAMNVLLWITLAKRPLKKQELQHALAVEPGDSDLNLDNFDKIDIILSVCAGLVTVDAEGGIIRLVHYTTQEYLEEKQHDLFYDAQYRMAETCATYLTFGTFTSRFHTSFFDEPKRYWLFDYSSQNWGHHVCKSGKLGPSVTKFFEDYKSLQRLCITTTPGGFKPRSNFTYRPDFTFDDIQARAIQLSSYYGVEIAVAHLIHEGANPNSRDDYGKTPLFYAAENGHEDVLKLLLSRSDVAPDAIDSRGRTPFSYAAGNGRDHVVRLLLGRDDVVSDSADNDGRTPLSHAALNGHEDVVKLLLSRDDVVPDATDGRGKTPLSCAAGNGHEAVAQLLLSRDDVNPDLPDKYGRTPLSYASGNGRESVVQLLLSRDDVVLNSADGRGRTPLSYAAEKGREAVVELLLGRDNLVPDLADKHDRTPLSYAAQSGFEAVVQLLLSRDDVVPDSTDGRGRTPLSYAAEKGREAVVRLLLGCEKIVPDSTDGRGRTPLFYAAKSGCEAVVQLLNSRDGVVSDSADNDGRASSSCAVVNGHEDVL